jgi:hypothetical protein
MAHCCPICYDSKISITSVCMHNYCITCLVRLQKCAFCRASFYRPYLEDIKNRNQNRFHPYEQPVNTFITNTPQQIRPQTKIMQRFDGVFYQVYIN